MPSCRHRSVSVGHPNPAIHLQYLIKEFVEHYLTERFHQGIGGQLIRNHPGSTNDNGTSGRIACRSRLGGLLNYYHREAA